MEKEEDELSLIDILKSIKVLFTEFKKKWHITLVFVSFSAIVGFLYAYNSKPKYTASSTMMMETSNKGGSMGGALALASQFGLMNGGGASSEINDEKLIEIIKAETIIKTALFKTTAINSKNDLLANHFIDLFGYKKAWESNDSLKKFRFTHDKENLTLLENQIFKMFYSRILKNMITSEKSKSGIITITTNSTSESFSKYFNQYLVEALTEFYVNRITQKGKVNLSIIQNRVDSIAIALKNAEFALARWKDSNFQLVKAQGMIGEMQLRRNIEVSNSIYIEGIKQLEVSKFTLLQDTPFLQIIDQPSFPIESSGKISVLKGLIFGSIIGLIFSLIFIFIRKKYADLMLEVELSKKI
jgi:uncharacterized protein involved in exopolysaccharide biosynthesis